MPSSRHAMRKISDWSRRRTVLGALAVLFVGVLLWLAEDVRTQIASLSSADRDNTQWVMSQSSVELIQLELAADQAARDGDAADLDAADLDALRLAFDLFYSRIATWNESRTFARIRDDPVIASKLAQMTAFVEDVVPLVDGPDTALIAGLPGLIERVREIRDVLRSANMRGIAVMAASNDAQRASVSGTLQTVALLVIALAGVLLAMIFALARLVRLTESYARDQATIRERIETIVATSLDAIIAVDQTGRIREWNGAAETIFGYRRDEVLGAEMAALIVPEHHRAGHKAGLDRIRRGGPRHVLGRGIVQLEARRKSGEIFPVDLALAEARSSDGPIHVGFIRDISERLDAETALRDARDRAVAGEKAKSDMLAVMSHEMRTPLNGLLGTLELFETDTLSPEQRRHFATIRSAARVLLGHVTDVLDISRLDARRMPSDRVEIDLDALLGKVVENQSALAARRGNRLELIPSEPAARRLVSDPGHVTQIVLNLVSNAIKFTRDGTITLETECHADLRQIEIRVIDAGVGIPEDQTERIFDEFVTIDNTYARDSAGTGLGLAISRRLARALGGELGVESVEGEGSVFYLRLPVLPDAALADMPPLETEVTAPPPGRVLIVEDNAVNRMVLHEMLVRDGHSVTEAEDGPGGVAAARAETFDAILMDISMPGLDGMAATRAIRGAPGPSRNAPIVATTANVLPEDRARFIAAGMTAVLAKPILRADLRRALSGAMVARATPPAEPEPPLVDWPVVEDLAATLPPARIQAALAQMRADMTRFLDEAAAASVPTGEALAAGAHRQAGAAAIFGATRLADCLRRLETAARDRDTAAAIAAHAAAHAAWTETAKALGESRYFRTAPAEAG